MCQEFTSSDGSFFLLPIITSTIEMHFKYSIGLKLKIIHVNICHARDEYNNSGILQKFMIYKDLVML